MKSILWFQASGEHYKPSTIATPFDRHHDSGSIKPSGKDPGLPYQYGYSEVRTADDAPLEQKLHDLLRRISPIAQPIREAGADSLGIYMLFYEGTSATVDIRSEDLATISAIGCELLIRFESNKIEKSRN